MIESRYSCGTRVFIPVCDGCIDELDEEYDFQDAVNAAKNAGWKSKRVYGVWMDLCDDCLEAYGFRACSAIDDFKSIIGGFR